MKPLLIFTVLTVCLAGCSFPVLLTQRETGQTAPGQIVIRAIPPHRIEVSLDGKTYQGDWRGEAVDDLAAIRQSEGAVSRHYQRHASGLEGPHVRRAQAELAAEDGSRLFCEWTWTGFRGDGECVDAGGSRYRLSAGSAIPPVRVLP